MIRIQIQKKNNQISRIQLSGHSDYAEYGSDIVCSAVSCLAITIVNSLEKILQLDGLTYSSDDGYLDIHLPQQIDETKKDKVDLLLQTLLLGLKDIQESYPEEIYLEN